MKATQETKKLYEESAADWKRVEPILLSDYSARPFVIDLCEPIVNKNILDLGCGEGYVGRDMKPYLYFFRVKEKLLLINTKTKSNRVLLLLFPVGVCINL